MCADRALHLDKATTIRPALPLGAPEFAGSARTMQLARLLGMSIVRH